MLKIIESRNKREGYFSGYKSPRIFGVRVKDKRNSLCRRWKPLAPEQIVMDIQSTIQLFKDFDRYGY